MTRTRITLIVLEDERAALLQLAQRERRDFRDQAALIIRQELERRGLLPIDAIATDAARESAAQAVENAVA